MGGRSARSPAMVWMSGIAGAAGLLVFFMAFLFMACLFVVLFAGLVVLVLHVRATIKMLRFTPNQRRTNGGFDRQFAVVG